MNWTRCIVAAPGPSLTWFDSQLPMLAVNDAWRLLPTAQALYGCDPHWWKERAPKPDEFKGERWSCLSHWHDKSPGVEIGWKEEAHALGIQTIASDDGDTFCLHPGKIHHGAPLGNSGFQAVNLAMQWGARHIILVGFDMRAVNGKEHFWGNYEAAPFYTPLQIFETAPQGFADAAKLLPVEIRIVNVTPNSALVCFPMMSLEDALHDSLHWHGAVAHTRAG